VRPTSGAVARLVVLTLLGAVSVACGAGQQGPEPVTGSTPSMPTVTPTTTDTPAGERPDRTTRPIPEEAPMRIEIEVDGRIVGAVLDDSPAARDLMAQLPAEVAMRDHHGVEKTGRLPAPLSTEGQPDVGDPAVGDLGYYAPGQDLVLYYGDAPAYPGIVVLGRLDAGAADTIAAVDGGLDVTVTRAGS